MFFQSLPYDPERPDLLYENGVLIIGNKDLRKGSQCRPTDAKETFMPLLNEFNLLASMNIDLKVLFYLSYMNTSSIRYWNEIINILNKMHANGCKIEIIWHYLEIDERIQEQGEDLAFRAKFKFNLKKL